MVSLRHGREDLGAFPVAGRTTGQVRGRTEFDTPDCHIAIEQTSEGLAVKLIDKGALAAVMRLTGFVQPRDSEISFKPLLGSVPGISIRESLPGYTRWSTIDI